jgi:hypothetical protein
LHHPSNDVSSLTARGFMGGHTGWIPRFGHDDMKGREMGDGLMRRQGKARMLVGSCSFAFYILHLIFQYLQVLLLPFFGLFRDTSLPCYVMT